MDRPSDEDFMSYLDAACGGDVRAVTAFLDRYPAAIDDHPWHIETTALIEAAARGKHAMVELLIERGADVDKADSPSRTTPLIAAAERGSAAIVRTLLSHGARTDLKNAKGDAAADVAQRRGYDDIAAVIRAGMPLKKHSKKLPEKPAPGAREKHDETIARLREKARGKNLRVKGKPRP
jgi:ankyrin repeat protein